MHVLLRTPSRVSLTTRFCNSFCITDPSRFRLMTRISLRSFSEKPAQPLQPKSDLDSIKNELEQTKTSEPISPIEAKNFEPIRIKEPIQQHDSEKSDEEGGRFSNYKIDKNALLNSVARQTKALSSYLRLIGIVLATIAGACFLFRKELQEFLGKQTAAVTTLTITDPEVQTNVHELATEVVQELLVNPHTKVVVVDFVRSVLEDPTTSKYVVQLANGVILDPNFQATAYVLAQGIVAGVLADPATTQQVTDLAIRVSQQQATQDALRELFVHLFNDPYMNSELQKMFTAALASESVTNQSKVLANDTVQYLMQDPEINNMARAFINSTLSTDSVQEAAGNAVWEALKIAFTPSVLASNYNSNRPNTDKTQNDVPNQSPSEEEETLIVPEDGVVI